MSACSLAAMPSDYEMLVSHSPPLFSHSPPLGADFFYSRLYAPRRRSPPPARPCLVLRADADPAPQDLPSPTKLKKKVVFADDKGLSLTQVRVMSEPSNVPPSWTAQFLEQVTGGLRADPVPDPWEVAFPQPASDYLHFRTRLDSDHVSLENVIVKETEQRIVGTVKVRNLSFHKEVVVRSSSDDWTTHEDAYCTYVDNHGAAGAYVLYDTFSFQLALPPRSRRLEFCVCFRCEGQEFWDNNCGKNYAVLKKGSGAGGGSATTKTAAGKFTDAVYAKVDTWSEFASWNHLVNDTPYW